MAPPRNIPKHIPQKRDSNGVTLVMEAARQNLPAKIAELAGMKHDLNLTDNAGLTALLHATIQGHEEAALMLMFHKADLALLTPQNASALHYAAEHALNGVIQRWIEYKGPLDTQDKIDKRTPLMMAIRNNDIFSAEQLIRAGADFAALADKNGYTAERMGQSVFTGKDLRFFNAAIKERRDAALKQAQEEAKALTDAAHKLEADVDAPTRATFNKKKAPIF